MKNHATRSFLLIAIACLALGACSPRVYLPDRVNAPMLREQGDVRLTMSSKIQGNGNTNKFTLSPSLDFAASPVNGLGLMASYRHTNRYANEDDIFDSVTDPDSIHYSGNRLELGAGYYMPFGRKGLFEIYGGGGWGDFNRDNIKKYASFDANFQTRYYMFFIQPALGFYARDVFEFSGGIRFAYHKYNYFHGDPDMRYKLTDPNTDIESTSFLFVDPYINLNVGYQYVKFNMQMGANVCASTPQIVYGDLPFYVSLGLTFQLSPRYGVSNKNSKE